MLPVEGIAEKQRTEAEVFAQLAELCKSPGYAHAIAYFCFRYNIIRYRDEVKAEDLAELFSRDRLIRTEISTLIGLMARGDIDCSLPTPKKIQNYIDRTEALLKELHEVLARPFVETFKKAFEERKANPSSTVNPFDNAAAMREPIFYGGEGAHSFQYRDLSPVKYVRDEEWLRQNKAFTIEEAKNVSIGVSNVINNKLVAVLRSMPKLPPDRWSMLDGFKFSASEVAAAASLSVELVERVLLAFTFPGDGNPTFTALNEFNSTNARPLLRVADQEFVLFQTVSLFEALYEAPFYWMIADKTYENTALANRGIFAEEFAAERLEHVFGGGRVFSNVDIWRSKGKKLGEIDALVLFADRAIIVQAKAKKLTLDARKGNDLQLRGDFKGAVQDACDQAYACSQGLLSSPVTLTDGSGTQVALPKSIKEIFQICLVADHYPALTFQSRQFLKYQTTDVIRAPLVCDVFLLDVMTEVLSTPLRCLSYLELRARAGDNLAMSQEMNALGFHLKRNLWLGEYDFMLLEDDLATDLDLAMTVRREGIKGNDTPPGILTQLRGTAVGRIIQQIEKEANAVPVALGLQLLRLSEDAARDISGGIDKIVKLAAKDDKEHDLTVALAEAKSGITIHCNSLPTEIARPKLLRHAKLRKYSQKAAMWFGILLRPPDGTLRAALVLDEPWVENAEMDKQLARMPAGMTPDGLRRFVSSKVRRKIGRNDPCPCGSGLKYKKCCLNKPR